MRNYYQILQVDPRAEPEVIEAAYRRLMRKYHPDVLSAEDREREETQRRVRELNEAYEVLRDPQKRSEYDAGLKAPRKPPKPKKTPEVAEVEKRMYLVRCGITKRTFRMLLGRRRGNAGPFLVLGFEVVPEIAPAKKANIVSRALSKVFSKKVPNPGPTGHMTDDEIQSLFDSSITLGMSDIDWGGHACPDCGSEVVNPNGTHGRWARCGTCSRLRCSGGMTKQADGYYSTCPWCGKRNKLTRSVATGSGEHVPIVGRIDDGAQPTSSKAEPAIEAKQRPRLEDGKGGQQS